MAVTLGINDLTVPEQLAVSAGRLGSTFIADTVAHTGIFTELVAMTACVIAAVTGNCAGLAGKTIPAGMSVAGVFTSVTLTSGTMVAYTGV
jgi:hypothetical protein